MTTTQLSLLDRRHQVNDLLKEMGKISDEINRTLNYCADAPTVHVPEDAAALVMSDMAHLVKEELRVILLNQRNQIKGIETVYLGSVSTSQVRVAEVFRSAIIDNHPAIVVCHNHPSGDPEPSPDDVALTRALVEAGKLLNIEVLDHLVIGNGIFVSLKSRRLGF
jgi:DNA repair protein RadC